MFKAASACLTSMGILLCPFVCGEEAGGDCATCVATESPCTESDQNTSCCCNDSVHEESCPTGRDRQPAPADDGCRFDCVCSGFTKSAHKPARELVRSWQFPMGVWDGPLAQGVSLDTAANLCTGTGPPDSALSYGASLRVAVASLLL